MFATLASPTRSLAISEASKERTQDTRPRLAGFLSSPHSNLAADTPQSAPDGKVKAEILMQVGCE